MARIAVFLRQVVAGKCPLGIVTVRVYQARVADTEVHYFVRYGG